MAAVSTYVASWTHDWLTMIKDMADVVKLNQALADAGHHVDPGSGADFYSNAKII